jgi:CHASE2 domain-containing sensor protein
LVEQLICNHQVGSSILSGGTIHKQAPNMFGLIYFICMIASLAFFVNNWIKSRNKVKAAVGIVIALIPVLNIVLFVAVVVQCWPDIKAWYEKMSK